MGDRVNLTLIGDGPSRTELEATAAALGLGGRVHWAGYIADRKPYLEMLAGRDLFVFPSEAEGFPKVVLDALAVGLPVLARPSGALRDLDVIRPMTDLERDVAALDAGGTDAWSTLARRGHAFARDHVRATELDRLVQHWHRRWPNLPWV